jgi:hypothetical protein
VDPRTGYYTDEWKEVKDEVKSVLNELDTDNIEPKKRDTPPNQQEVRLLGDILSEVRTTRKWVAFMGIVLIISLSISIIMGLALGWFAGY